MNKYSDWLNNIKKVWEEKNLELLKTILADNIQWFESPFKDSLNTKSEVINQWNKDLEGQSNIHFNFSILIESKNLCVSNWNASFTHRRFEMIMDGIFYIELDNEGKCKVFRQWWVTK